MKETRSITHKQAREFFYLYLDGRPGGVFVDDARLLREMADTIQSLWFAVQCSTLEQAAAEALAEIRSETRWHVPARGPENDTKPEGAA